MNRPLFTDSGRISRFACAMLMALALQLVPAVAWAHTKLAKSDPGPNALVRPPDYISLWFSEKPELAFTKISLIDAAGKPVPDVGDVVAGNSETSVRARLYHLLEAGTYTVIWRTASGDGHPAEGRFSFRVLADSEVVDKAFANEADSLARLEGRLKTPVDSAKKPVAVAAAAPAATADSTSGANIVVRFGLYVSIMLVIGALSFRVAVLPRVRGLDPFLVQQLARSIAGGGAIAAISLIVFAGLRLVMEQQMLGGDAASIAMKTAWGAGWRIGAVAGGIALIGFIIARKADLAGWALVAISSVVIAVASALSGHAGATQVMRGVSIAADAIHVIAVSAWMGGVFWLSMVALPFARRTPEHRARRAAAIVSAFSPMAMFYVAIVVASGVTNAWLRVGSIENLINTGYGVTLLSKLAVFFVVLAIGYINWKSVRKAMGSDRAASRLDMTARAELFVGFVVILLTAVLVGMSLPPGM